MGVEIGVKGGVQRRGREVERVRQEEEEGVAAVMMLVTRW